MRWLAAVTMTATILVTAAGCGGATKTVTVEEQATTTAAGSTMPDPPSPEGLGSAQTVELESGGALSVTVEAINPDPPKPEFESRPLKGGTHWANVEVALANESTRPVDQSEINYLLISGKGETLSTQGPNAYEPVVSCCGGGYNGSMMQPGDKAAGFVAFAVPSGFEIAKVRAEPTFGEASSPVVEWEG